MEQKDENSMITSIDQKDIIPHESNEITPSSLKKGRGSKNIFKVALFMMRGRRSRKSKVLVVDDKSKSIWRKLVGSIRPLHLQSDDESPSPNNIIPQSQMLSSSQNDTDHEDDEFESASEFTYSPSNSRYASAIGLNEMVQEEENENEKEEEVAKENIDNDGDGSGDEMIDAKAEEFIAQFYRQIRLQSLHVMDCHYQEISMRSLGL